jgi:Ty3 transposon capsid-like protein
LQQPSSNEKVKVRNPEPFNGSEPCKLRNFLVSCNLHFCDRPKTFATDEKKILFVLSYLKGSAISWFEPGLMDKSNSAHWIWNFDAFLNELETNFGPHDPVGDAEKELTEISMKDHHRVMKYNVDFWKLASRVDWNESTLYAHYFSGLPARLHVEVIRGGKPDTLVELRLKAQDADEIYWMMKVETNNNSRSKPTPSTSKKDDKPSASYSASTPLSSAKTASKPQLPPAKGKPKDSIADKLGKDGKLQTSKRERRLKEGLCLYCGKKGHSAKDCFKANAAKARAVKVEPEAKDTTKN